jgi:hypothetical protein
MKQKKAPSLLAGRKSGEEQQWEVPLPCQLSAFGKAMRLRNMSLPNEFPLPQVPFHDASNKTQLWADAAFV